ncbi:MAG: Clp protease N-terminal domain-containing protein [Chloroflexota bacterium]
MGPFDRFNDRAKRVLALAQDEAIRFNHNYIGTEHLLMGLVREGEGVAARVLDSLNVDLSKVRTTVERTIGRGDSTKSPSEITLTPQMKKVVELATDEARKLGHSHVGTEHLLLGIVRENESPGAKVLASFGVSLETVRHNVIATLGQPHREVGASAPMPPSSQSNRNFAGPFDRFNDRAKRVLALAQDEAIRFNHNHIGPEHLLLGLAREGEGIAARALEALGATLSKLRATVEKVVGRGDATISPREITLSPHTKRIIEYAIEEASKLGHNDVGTEHLLLGLVRHSGHLSGGVLEAADMSLESIREKVIEMLGQPTPDAAPPSSLRSLTTFASFGGTLDRLNDRARKVLAYAQEEAIRFKHNYIGTEHLLLGLVREGESAAARALNSLGVELSKVRTAVEFIIGTGEAVNMPSSPSELTISPRAKKVLELAIDEARKLGHSDVGPEHLLLGLVREGEGIASGVIESLGVTLAKVRQQLIASIGQVKTALPTNAYANTLLQSGPFDFLDDAAKRVLFLAEEEARQMRHNWIGTEHMLIALARSDGVAQRTLKELGVTLELARAGVFKAVPPAETEVTEVTVTPRVKTLLGKAIMLAAPQSDRVRPQHLLLALVSDPDGIGSQVLMELGATQEKVRKTVDKLTQG